MSMKSTPDTVNQCVILMALILLTMGAPLTAAGAEKSPPSPAAGDRRQVWTHISVLYLTEEGSKVLEGKNTASPVSLKNLVDAKKARELQAFHFPMQNGQQALAFIGHKFPVTWFDVRSSLHQLLFVDVGMKFALTPAITGDNTLNLDIRLEMSNVEDYRQEIERDTAFYFPSTKNSTVNLSLSGLRSGESAIIASFQGLSLENVLKNTLEKEALHTKGGRLVIAVTPEIQPERSVAAGAPGTEHPSALEIRTLALPATLAKNYRADWRLTAESLSQLVKSRGVRLIDSERILTSGRETSLLVGRKYPFAYYDPRSGSYQVIYSDIGLKGNYTCTPVGAHTWNLKVAQELSNADPATLFGLKHDQIPLKAYTIRTDTGIELARGESAILVALRGELYCRMIREVLIPGMEFSPGDELMFILTVQ